MRVVVVIVAVIVVFLLIWILSGPETKGFLALAGMAMFALLIVGMVSLAAFNKLTSTGSARNAVPREVLPS